MRWAVEYELPSGRVGLCLFEAEDEEVAWAYVSSMYAWGGHSHVFNLQELPEGTTVADLCKLFPRRVDTTLFR